MVFGGIALLVLFVIIGSFVLGVEEEGPSQRHLSPVRHLAEE